MQYGHRISNTLPPLPLFATLNLTRVALTSSLHSYVSSCHSQTPRYSQGWMGIDLVHFSPMRSHECPCRRFPVGTAPSPAACKHWDAAREINTLSISERSLKLLLWGCGCCSDEQVKKTRENSAADLSSSPPPANKLVWLSYFSDSVLDLSLNTARVVESCAVWADSGMQRILNCSFPSLNMGASLSQLKWCSGCTHFLHSTASVLLLSVSLIPHRPT